VIFVKGRCGRCGGNLFWDQRDGSVRCLWCACYVVLDGASVKWKVLGKDGKPAWRILTPLVRIWK
jgi:hypothetical protein